MTPALPCRSYDCGRRTAPSRENACGSAGRREIRNPNLDLAPPAAVKTRRRQPDFLTARAQKASAMDAVGTVRPPPFALAPGFTALSSRDTLASYPAEVHHSLKNAGAGNS